MVWCVFQITSTETQDTLTSLKKTISELGECHKLFYGLTSLFINIIFFSPETSKARTEKELKLAQKKLEMLSRMFWTRQCILS
jgi:hypothetical protein